MKDPNKILFFANIFLLICMAVQLFLSHSNQSDDDSNTNNKIEQVFNNNQCKFENSSVSCNLTYEQLVQLLNSIPRDVEFNRFNIHVEKNHLNTLFLL